MKFSKFKITMILLTLCYSIASLFPTILLNYWIGQQIILDKFKIAFLLAGLIFALIIDLFLIFIRENFAYDFNINNNKKFMSEFLKMNYDEIAAKGPSNFIERIALSVNSIYTYYTCDFVKIYANIIIMAVLLIMVAKLNVPITLLLLIAIPINIVSFKMLNKELLKRSKIMQEQTSSGWQDILSLANQTDYLKQCDTHEIILNKHLSPAFNKIYGSMANVNKFAQTVSRTIYLFNMIAKTLIMIIAVYDYLTYDTNPLTIALYGIIMPLFFSSLNEVVNANLNKRDVINSLQFYEQMKNNAESSGDKVLEDIDIVEFKIPQLSIKNKTLTGPINGVFTKGDIIKVAGPSGVGKSTLVQLLPKFRQIEGVYINGTDIRDYDNASLRKKVTFLSQDVAIVKGTLRENLFLNKNYSQDVEEKLESDTLLSSILKTKTMDDLISEKGANLSGGEKQKIALARSLYDDNVRLLILDEITSNIDKTSAEEIYQRLLQDRRTKIVFIISHDDIPDKYCNKHILLSEKAEEVSG